MRRRISANTTSVARLYKILCDDLHLPDEKAKAFIEDIDATLYSNRENNYRQVAGKVLTKEGFSILEEKFRKVELNILQTKNELASVVYLTSYIQFIPIILSRVWVICIPRRVFSL